MSDSTRLDRFSKYSKVIAEIATVLGVFVVFIAYLELKSSEEQTALNTMGQVYSQMVTVDQMFLDHPEARYYIYSNLRPEDVHPNATPEQRMNDEAAAMNAAELMLDFFSNVILVMPKLGDATEGWETYIKDVYKCSPAIQSYYENHIAWYKDEKASQIINKAKAELKEIEAKKGTVACDKITVPAK